MTILIDSLAEQTAPQLLEQMARRETERELAEEACEELFRRFSRRLLAAAFKYSYLGADFDPEMHMSETFIRVYRHAGSFTCPPEVTEPDKIEEKVLIWLFRIQRNLIIDFCNARYSKIKLAEAAAKAPKVARKGLANISPEFGEAAIKDLLLIIPPPDKELLLTSYSYYNEVSGECEIPDKIRNQLCARLGITPENLRTRRLRLVNRLIKLAMSKQNPPGPSNL